MLDNIGEDLGIIFFRSLKTREDMVVNRGGVREVNVVQGEKLI